MVGPFSVIINGGDPLTNTRNVTLTLEAGGDTAWAKIDNDWRFPNAQWVVFNASLAGAPRTPLYIALIILVGFGLSGFWISKLMPFKTHLVVVALLAAGGLMLTHTAVGTGPTIQVPWELSEGYGAKTVYVQFYTRDKEGGSSSPLVEDSIMYGFTEETETPAPEGGVGGFNPEANPTPPVLPARIGDRDQACAPLITTTMALWLRNDTDQVSRLQTFLREVFGFQGLPTTGVFDATTDSVVRAFQLQYREDILRPWPVSEPTGIVAFYTRRAINYLWCVTRQGS